MSRRRTDAASDPTQNPPETPEVIETAREPEGLAAVMFQPPTSPGHDRIPDPEDDLEPTELVEGPLLSSSPSEDLGAGVAGGDSPPRSTADRADRRTLRARARDLVPVLAAAVATVGGVAHQLLTREGTPERDAGLWLPDEEDTAAISEPLAGLASRRVPAGVDNPDVTDLAQLAMGLIGYVVKQRAKAAEVARRAFLSEAQADEQAAAGAPEQPTAWTPERA